MARDLRPQGAGLIGQQDLFSQAHHETADPQGKTLKAFGPGVQLRGNVLVADNGAGNELGEHGHIGSEAYDIVLDRSSPPVYIDGVGHGLERIKGDPNGKGQAQERDPASGEAVDGTDEKVRIFKDHQKGQIDERRGGYRHPAAFRFPRSKKRPTSFPWKKSTSVEKRRSEIYTGSPHP